MTHIFHYRAFVTYLLAKSSLCYPSPACGDIVTKSDVLASWQKTARLISSGKVPSKFFMYVHIPFCRSHCLYCMSMGLKLRPDEKVFGEYLKLLFREMRDYSRVLKKLEVTTLYFGGGTPSLLSAPEIRELMDNLREKFLITRRTRIIFEASPFTLDHEKLDVLKAYRLHELDLGVQSLDDEVLRKNGRPQSARQALDIIRYAKKIGIPSVKVDLMAGMPYQSQASAVHTLAQVMDIPVDAVYVNPFRPLEWTRFCLEGNTYSEGQIQMRNKTRELMVGLLDRYGYKHTTVGYRKKWGPRDRDMAYHTQESHNLLGFGHGAFSHALASLKYQQVLPFGKLVHLRPDAGGKEIIRRLKNPSLAKTLSFQYNGIKMDMKKEMCVFAYTHLYNLSLSRFKKRFREDFRRVFKKQLDLLVSRGWVVVREGKIRFLQEDPFVRRLIRAFFIDEDYIEHLKRVSREDYDPRKDYAALGAPFVA